MSTGPAKSPSGWAWITPLLSGAFSKSPGPPGGWAWARKEPLAFFENSCHQNGEVFSCICGRERDTWFSTRNLVVGKSAEHSGWGEYPRSGALGARAASHAVIGPSGHVAAAVLLAAMLGSGPPSLEKLLIGSWKGSAHGVQLAMTFGADHTCATSLGAERRSAPWPRRRLSIRLDLRSAGLRRGTRPTSGKSGKKSMVKRGLFSGLTQSTLHWRGRDLLRQLLDAVLQRLVLLPQFVPPLPLDHKGGHAQFCSRNVVSL